MELTTNLHPRSVHPTCPKDLTPGWRPTEKTEVVDVFEDVPPVKSAKVPGPFRQVEVKTGVWTKGLGNKRDPTPQ